MEEMEEKIQELEEKLSLDAMLIDDVVALRCREIITAQEAYNLIRRIMIDDRSLLARWM